MSHKIASCQPHKADAADVIGTIITRVCVLKIHRYFHAHIDGVVYDLKALCESFALTNVSNILSFDLLRC